MTDFIRIAIRDIRTSALILAVYLVFTAVSSAVLIWHDSVRAYLISRSAFGMGHLAVCGSPHVHAGVDLIDTVPFTAIRDALRPVKECRAVLPRLRFDAVLTAGEKGVRAVGFGIDTERERSHSPMRRIVSGTSPAGTNDIVITRAAARMLGAEAGNYCTAIALTREGAYAGRRFRISGIAAVPLKGYEYAFFADISGCYSFLRTDAPQYAVIDCEKHHRETIEAVIRTHPLLNSLHIHVPESTGALRTFGIISLFIAGVLSLLMLAAAVVSYMNMMRPLPRAAIRRDAAKKNWPVPLRIARATRISFISLVPPVLGSIIGTAGTMLAATAITELPVGIVRRMFAIPPTDTVLPLITLSLCSLLLFPVLAFLAGTAAVFARYKKRAKRA